MKAPIKPRNHAGFTLTELMVVIAIIAVLTSIAFPMISRGVYKSKVMRSVASLRNVGMANLNYSQDNNSQVCGLGKQTMPQFGRPNHFEGIMWQVAAYSGAGMSANGGLTLTWSDVVDSLERLYQPHLDKNITWGPDDTRWSVAINTEFSSWPGPDRAGKRQNSKYPRMTKVLNPASTIYACSGIWSVTAEQARDRAFLELPTSRPRNGPYFTKTGQLPVVYVDGSAGLAKFPLSKAAFALNGPNY